MNLESFTSRAQEAVTSCRGITSRFGQREVAPEHLLLALLEQRDGMAERIFKRLEVEPGPIIGEIESYLQKQPKSSSVSENRDEILVSSRVVAVFDAAKKEADRLKDQYISVEHLMLALCDESRSQAGTILKQAGITRERILQAMT